MWPRSETFTFDEKIRQLDPKNPYIKDVVIPSRLTLVHKSANAERIKINSTPDSELDDFVHTSNSE